MIRRLAWPGLLVAACCAAGLLARGSLQPAVSAPPLPLIAGLSPNYAPTGQSVLSKALEGVGYREGSNIMLEERWADGVDARLDGFAEELVQLKPKVMVALNPTGVLAAQRVTTSIPIVFVSITDPLALHLVQSLSRPGGNITGVGNMPADLSIKRLELLKDAMPDVTRVGLLARAANTNSHWHMGERVALGERLGLEMRAYIIDGPQDYDAIFARMAAEGIQAIALVQDSIFYVTRTRLAGSARAHGLALISGSVDETEAGALFGYGLRSYIDVWSRAALYVDKILRGGDPAEIPIEQPMEVLLAVNLRVARELGIDLPRAFLLRANVVIE